MKLKLIASASLLSAFAVTAQAGVVDVTLDLGGGLTGSLDVEERIEGFDNGVYNVMNNTNGAMLAFGVSNIGFSRATVYNDDGFGDFGGCEATFCYNAYTLTSRNWNDSVTTVFAGEGVEELTFQDLFGDFATAADGDDVFHWFTGYNGALEAGEAVDDFFGFQSLNVSSSIIGIAETSTGLSAFRAGSAVPPSAVPLPAAGLLLIAGLGGLGVASRRKKA